MPALGEVGLFAKADFRASHVMSAPLTQLIVMIRIKAAMQTLLVLSAHETKQTNIPKSFSQDAQGEDPRKPYFLAGWNL